MVVSRKRLEEHEEEECMQCEKTFTLSRRKINCSHCGGLYCGDCANKKSIILKFGYDSKVIVCDTCYELLGNCS